MKKTIKRIGGLALLFIVLGCVWAIFISFYMKFSTQKNIMTKEDLSKEQDFDCALILGAQVKADRTPSKMLRDRLKAGIELYKEGIVPKLIMSGDHGQDSYDEVNVMKQYAIDAGVPSEDIFMDHAGFSTYDSAYRAKHVFKVKKLIMVSQEYHLYRAIYNGKKQGIKTYGYSALKVRYPNQTYRDFREILARNKAFLLNLTNAKPQYLGDEIPITGNGDVTNDK